MLASGEDGVDGNVCDEGKLFEDDNGVDMRGAMSGAGDSFEKEGKSF
jgi:hypothetical protein